MSGMADSRVYCEDGCVICSKSVLDLETSL